MGSDSIRPAAVAGSWYPGTAGALEREVDRHLASMDPQVDLPQGTLHAIVAPHAGLMFSGPVSAYAYKAASLGAFDTLILVGPSHFVAFDGVSIYPSGAFATPLGLAPIDEALGGELMAASSLIQPLPLAHRREHSLEMQLPFVRRLLPGTKIVPLLMGYQTRETIEELGTVLGGIAPGRRVLLVASTDLSHYFDGETASLLDARVQACVAAFDPARLLAMFEEYPEGERGRFVACGGGPAISVMLAARARGATSARVLKYMHSGEVSGDHSVVVGYLAAAMGSFSDVH